jgi:hypothetical protein
LSAEKQDKKVTQKTEKNTPSKKAKKSADVGVNTMLNMIQIDVLAQLKQQTTNTADALDKVYSKLPLSPLQTHRTVKPSTLLINIDDSLSELQSLRKYPERSIDKFAPSVIRALKSRAQRSPIES